MPKALKRNAVIVLGLSCLFYWSFMFAKHDPALRDVIPFGEDPYDAVGSFAVIVGMLIALLSLVRAFRPYREGPTAERRLYLIRSQEAIVLAIFMTLASDVVAMGRHPSVWIGSASRDKLIGLIGGMALLTALVQWIICASRENAQEHSVSGWAAAASSASLAVLILAVYPEQWIRGTAPHLLTVIAGDLLLFAPMPLLLKAIVPYPPDNIQVAKAPPGNRLSTAGKQWIIVVLVGLFIGACVFLGETGEGGNMPPLSRLLFVASVFSSLGLAGCLIAYAFLRKPLGLER